MVAAAAYQALPTAERRRRRPNPPSHRRATGSQMTAPPIWARTISTRSRPGTLRTRAGTAHSNAASKPTRPISPMPATSLVAGPTAKRWSADAPEPVEPSAPDVPGPPGPVPAGSMTPPPDTPGGEPDSPGRPEPAGAVGAAEGWAAADALGVTDEEAAGVGTSVGSGRVGSGRVGSGRVGIGRVGIGRVGTGRVGTGRVGEAVGA